MSIAVSHHSLANYPGLANDWQGLEARARNDVFLSWAWMSTWLQQYQPNAIVVKAERDGVVVGLGILVVYQSKRRLGLLQSKQLHLHQTGVPAQDQIWIEYNDFLTSEPCQAQMLAYLQQQVEFDELVLGAIRDEDLERLNQQAQMPQHELWTAPSFQVNLANMPDYKACLSRNTRYQINRSAKRYEQAYGPLHIERPESLAQALQWFDDIGPLHLKRWGTGNAGSGYANPEFIGFHHRLIRQTWQVGLVDLVRVYAGEELIATFYNLAYRGKVYFYLGGLAEPTDNQLKPGLLGHSLCIENYRQRGYHTYDFMGGNERYKTQMAKKHCQLHKVALQQPHWGLALERLARLGKQQLGKQQALRQGYD
ncbi:GNAT family N-acetyltransferase [Salinibius halmophilus]|uniref:GNAT family N-acetyltransferase n=1 Tax=Salinibius halmophilus TaxID=1853216 RepID=UPI0018F5B77C|nr:GNAT family N-acetyltransferase [Salinibius halmophilus]